MGLPWMQVRQAVVVGDMVTVQILAADTGPEEEASVEPDPREAPAAEPGPRGKLHL